MNKPGYEQLAAVLRDAFDQAAAGKGAERHAKGQPFHEQRMQTISNLLDSDAGMAFQVCKKVTEGMALPHAARERELLGAINYIAGMVIFHRRKAAMPSSFGQKYMLDFDDARMDAIGQNGGEGLHYPHNEDDEKCGACSVEPGAVCGFGDACHQKDSPFKAMADSFELAEEAIQAGGKPVDDTIIESSQQPAEKIELPPTDHLVDPTGKPSWDDAPNWANYLTQNARGVWVFWQKEPRKIRTGWVSDSGMMAEVNSGKVVGDWRESLEEAPGHFVSGGKA